MLDTDGDVLKVDLDGSLDYINGLHFEIKVLDEINAKDSKYVIVDLSKVRFVDIDGLFILDNVFKKKGVEAVMVLATEDSNSVLCKSALYKKLNESGKVFSTVAQA